MRRAYQLMEIELSSTGPCQCLEHLILTEISFLRKFTSDIVLTPVETSHSVWNRLSRYFIVLVLASVHMFAVWEAPPCDQHLACWTNYGRTAAANKGRCGWWFSGTAMTVVNLDILWIPLSAHSGIISQNKFHQWNSHGHELHNRKDSACMDVAEDCIASKCPVCSRYAQQKFCRIHIAVVLPHKRCFCRYLLFIGHLLARCIGQLLRITTVKIHICVHCITNLCFVAGRTWERVMKSELTFSSTCCMDSARSMWA